MVVAWNGGWPGLEAIRGLRDFVISQVLFS